MPVVIVSLTSPGLEGSQQSERWVVLLSLWVPIVLADLDSVLVNLWCIEVSLLASYNDFLIGCSHN